MEKYAKRNSPRSQPPSRKSSSTSIKTQKSLDLTKIIHIEEEVRQAEELLESKRAKLSEAVINWLETYGERAKRFDRDSEEEYEIPHYPSALRVEGGAVQLFVRRLRNRDGVRTIGTLRRIATEG